MHFLAEPLELLPRFYSGSGPSTLSPDGSILYSCSLSMDNVPKLHATSIKKSIASFQSLVIESSTCGGDVESQDVPIAMIAGDGLLFVSFRVSNMLNVYEVSHEDQISARLHQSIIPHSDNNPVIGMCLFRPDILLTSSTDKTIRVWNIDSGTITLINSIRSNSVTIGMCCYSSDDILVTTSAEGAIRLWNVSTCKPMTNALISNEMTGEAIAGSACFGSKFFLVAYRSGVLIIWNLKSKSIIKRLGLPSGSTNDEITTVASFSYESPEVWIGTPSLGIFRLTSTFQLISSKEFSMGCNKLLVVEGTCGGEALCQMTDDIDLSSRQNSKGSRIVVLGQPTLPTLSIFDWEHKKATPTLTMTTLGDCGEITDLSSMGNCLIFASDSGALFAIGRGKGWPILASKVEDSPMLSLSEGMNGHILSGSKNGTISLWHVYDRNRHPYTEDCEINLEDSVNVGKNVAISGIVLTANDRVFCIGSDGMLRQWTIQSMRLISDSAIMGHSGSTMTSIAACQHMGYTFLITGSQDKTAKIWDASGISPLPKHALTGHTRGIWSVAINAIGHRDPVAFTASADMTIRVWNVNTGTALSVLGGPGVDGSHVGSILRVAFFPPSSEHEEGAYFASCGTDGLVKVWNWRSKTCESTIETKEFCTQKLWSLLVDPRDGRSILAGPGLLFSEISAEVEAKEHATRAQQMEAEQALRNAIALGAMDDAIRLALKNGQPLRFLTLLRQHPNVVDSIIETLPLEQQKLLLEWTSEWVTSRPSDAALCQHLLAQMLKHFPPTLLFEESKRFVSMLPYCQRLWERFDDGLVSLGALDALLASMTTIGLQ